MESKIDVQELIELHHGEFFSIFRGETVPSASFFIPDNEKSCSSDPVVINRYISVDAPRLDRLRRLVPRTAQRRIPSPENVSAIIGVLTAKPSRKRRRKIRTEGRTRSWIHFSNALQDVRRLWQCWKSTTQISTHVKVPCETAGEYA